METIASRLALDVVRVTLTFDPANTADRERIAQGLPPCPRRPARNARRRSVDRRRCPAPSRRSPQPSAKLISIQCGRTVLSSRASCWSSACAPKIVPSPVVTAPKFPEFIAPPIPAALGRQPAAAQPDVARLGVSAGQEIFGSRRARVRRGAEGAAVVLSGGNVARLPRARAQRSRKRRCRTSITPLELNASTAMSRRLSAGGRRLLAIEPRIGRARRVRGRARRGSLADGRWRDESKSSSSATSSRVWRGRARPRRPDAPTKRSQAYTRGDRQFARQRRFCIASSPASSGRRATATAALEHFRKAAALDPGDAESLAQIGEIARGRWRLRRRGQGLRRLAGDRAERRRGASGSRTFARRTALAHLPAEYRAIDQAAQITRGDLAALIGVRLAPLLQASAAQRRGADHRRAHALGRDLDHGGHARRRDGAVREPRVPAAHRRPSRPISRRPWRVCSRASRRRTRARANGWESARAEILRSRRRASRVSGRIGRRCLWRDEDGAGRAFPAVEAGHRRRSGRGDRSIGGARRRAGRQREQAMTAC